MARRRVTVRGVRKSEIDTDKLALAYWLMAKHALEQKRIHDAAEKKRRSSEGGQRAKR